MLHPYCSRRSDAKNVRLVIHRDSPATSELTSCDGCYKTNDRSVSAFLCGECYLEKLYTCITNWELCFPGDLNVKCTLKYCLAT